MNDEINKAASIMGKKGNAAFIKKYPIEQRKRWASSGGRKSADNKKIVKIK